MTVGRQPSGVVGINGIPYFLAKDPKSGVPMWHDRQVQTQEGDPTVPRRMRWKDWSRGMGDSRGVFQGAIEAAANAWVGAIGRILPGPAVTTVQTNHVTPITAIVEVTQPAARLITYGGQYGKELDSSWAIQTTKDFGSGKTVLDAQVYQGNVAIAMGDATQFQWRDTAGTYAASTTTTDSAGDYRYARAFGLSNEGDLVRAHANKWSKCASADFYGTNGNWSADYPIGDDTTVITDLFAFERWDYVLKEEGLYTFDQDTSQESNVLTDLAAFKSTANRRAFPWYNRLFLCTFAGLYRYIQNGGARTVGIEEAELNEGLMTNAYPTAGVAFGRWAYVAYYDPALAHSYICQIRNARDGDASFGSPFTMVNVIDEFDGQCLAMVITSISGTPHVAFGRDEDLSYFKLTRTGEPAVFRTSGSPVVTFSPNDMDSPMTVKYARSIESINRRGASTRTIQWALAWDGGSFNNVGTPITAAGFSERFLTLSSNDSGRVPQLKATLVNDDASDPIEVRDVILNYEERPVSVDGSVFTLRLRDGDHEGDVVSRLTAYEMKENLEALLDGAPVTFEDAYGDSYTAAFSGYRAYTGYGSDVDYQFKGEGPQPSMTIVVRRLDYS